VKNISQGFVPHLGQVWLMNVTTLCIVNEMSKVDLFRCHRQSAKIADWLVDNGAIWPVLRNCACATPGKLKIDRSLIAAEGDCVMLNYKDLEDCGS